MNRCCVAGEVIHLIDCEVERKSHVVAHRFEARMFAQPLDVALCAGKIIVDADNAGTLAKEPLAKMRAQEARSAGYQHTRFQVHESAISSNGSAPFEHYSTICRLTIAQVR